MYKKPLESEPKINPLASRCPGPAAQLNSKRSWALKIFSRWGVFLVAAVSISTCLGVGASEGDVGIGPLKWIAGLGDLFLLTASLLIIRKYKHSIKWGQAFPLLMVTSFIPIARIMIAAISTLDVRSIINGLIIDSSYYQLPIIAAALAVLIVGGKVNATKMLHSYGIACAVIAPIAIWITVILGFPFGISYTTYENILIPVSLLAFSSPKQMKFWIGIGGIFTLFMHSTLQGSRSYNVVSVLLALGALWNLRAAGTRVLFALLIFGVPIIGPALLLFGDLISATLSHSAAAEKYQVESLSTVLNRALDEASIMPIWEWDGNSRKEILADAFSDFSFFDWLFGKGIFGKYESFVVRSTIEVGWAQEVFWWGLLQVGMNLLVLLLALKRLSIWQKRGDLPFPNGLRALIFIKLVDGFIYGMPMINVYNLFIFLGVMLPATDARGVRQPRTYGRNSPGVGAGNCTIVPSKPVLQRASLLIP